METGKGTTWFAPAKFADNEKICDASAKNFFNPIEGKRWVAFMGTIILLYLSLYGTSRLFTWESDEKPLSDHYYQLLYLVILSHFLFTFGNFQNTFSTWFVLGLFVGAFGICILGAVPGFQFSTGSLTSLSGVPLFTVLGIAAVIIYFFYRTFNYYRKCGMTNMFAVFLLIPIAILALGLLIARTESSTVEVHLHHWQWALLFVFYARFPGIPWQSFLSGLFVGIVVDGIARYGPDPLFIPVTP